MRQNIKRFLALVLSVVLCLTALPLQVFADELAVESKNDYLSQCANTGTYLLLKAASDGYIKTLPCSKATDSSSKDVRKMTVGETLAATEIYKNTAGNFWYYVTTTTGDSGYIFGEDATFTSIGGNAILSDVAISTTTPTRGKSYDIKGSISTTKLGTVTLKSAKGVLKDATGATQTKTITSGFSDISSTALNSGLKFGSLSRGPGSLTVTTTGSCPYIATGTSLGTKTTTVTQTINFVVQDTYKVIYNANGGTNAPASQNKTYGKNLTLTSSVPTRVDYTFLGWSTSSTATSATYKAGAVLKTDVYTGDITLYAVWKYAPHTHTYGNWETVTAATCTTDGLKRRTCTSCSATEEEVIPATGHQYTDTVVDPTCTATGYTNHTCACGDSYKDTYVNALGHDWGQWVAWEDGLERRDCTRCDAFETQETDIPVEELEAPVIRTSSDYDTGSIKISWDAVDGASKYYIYRKVGSSGSYKFLAGTPKTSYTNTSVEPGITYYYKVTAIGDDDTSSDYSNVSSRTCDLPRPVITLNNVFSSGKIKISWDAVDGAEKYYIYRRVGSSGEYKYLCSTTNTSLTNTSTAAGTTYYYKVKAVHENSAANSAYSSVRSRTCDLPRPVVSISLSSAGKPKLTWDPIDGAVKYYIYRSTSENGEYSYLYATTKTSFTNTGAKAGTTYYYKVKAVHENTAANSALSYRKYIKAK